MTSLLTVNLVGDVARTVKKTCVKCGQVKYLFEFHKHSADALPWMVRTDCKTCFSARSKLYQLSHREEIRTVKQKYSKKIREAFVYPAGSLTCSKCGAEKPSKEFARSVSNPSGLTKVCKPCARIQMRTKYWPKFYAAHREQIIADTQRYAEQHPEYAAAKNAARRARMINARGSCSPTQLADRVRFYGNMCVYCGADAETIDHVIPLARGGSNWPANFRPACHSCNSSKTDKKIAEWIHFRGFLSPSPRSL